MEKQDRVAVITGATGGLGRVVTRQLAGQGLRLSVFSSNQDKLESLIQEFGLTPERTHIQALDFRQADAARMALQATLEKFGRADILLHFVGGWTGGVPLVDVEGAKLDEMIQQHVWTTFHLAKSFIPTFQANDWGRMIVVSSPVAGLPAANSAPYAAAKAAQEALLLALAQENCGTGVTANIIRVQTIDVKHQRDMEPTSKNISWTTPEEIAAAVRYLISDEAAVVNGIRMPLYGSP
jgi:NAD(P)-dependent dehydrogenase (short-subunit alcohol dehydrogenase family)